MNFVPLPFTVSISMTPPKDSTLDFTASIPTPLPEMFDTFPAVLIRGSKRKFMISRKLRSFT